MPAHRLLAAPDKFRGTASAAEVAGAMARAADEAGWTYNLAPVSDGGEGLLACVGGANRETTVSGPLGDPVLAAWRRDGDCAWIEMAQASGLALVAGHNDPMRASTTGTGELIRAAIGDGATEIIVGVGGSATTDGGRGAVEILRGLDRGAVRITVAADVTTLFTDAARLFAPQKGADPAQVAALERRLAADARDYEDEFGIDVSTLPGSGAAGGLAGGLAALGATITSGFDVIATAIGLDTRIAEADLVLTGEGAFDATSLLGKAPTGVLTRCARLRTAAGLIAGRVLTQTPDGVVVADLARRYGERAAMSRPASCITAATAELLARHGEPRP